MTSDVFCRVFIDNGQDVFHEEKFGQVQYLTLLNINKGSKSFLLKKTRDRHRFANEDKGASRIAILD